MKDIKNMNTQKAIQAIDAVTVAIVNGVINTSLKFD